MAYLLIYCEVRGYGFYCVGFVDIGEFYLFVFFVSEEFKELNNGINILFGKCAGLCTSE